MHRQCGAIVMVILLASTAVGAMAAQMADSMAQPLGRDPMDSRWHPGGELHRLDRLDDQLHALAAAGWQVEGPGTLPGIAAMQAAFPDDSATGAPIRGDVEGDGIEMRWATSFLGTPQVLDGMDLDGDGIEEIIAGTDVGIIAATLEGEVLWIHPTAGEVTHLVPHDDGQPLLLYASDSVPTAYIGALRADGSTAWQYDELARLSAMELATDAGGADVLGIDLYGDAVRLDVGGNLVWTNTNAAAPSTSAVVASAYLFYHPLGIIADVDGDGERDIVSAQVLDTNVYVPFALYASSDSLIVRAMSGTDGGLLWLRSRPTPPLEDVSSYVIPLDMAPVDVDGDGAYEVALTAYDSHYVWGTLGLVSADRSWWTVLDADGPAGYSVGGREVLSPALLPHIFGHVAASDGDLDGRDEVALTTASAIGSLLGQALTVERYAVATNALGQETMVAVADLSHAYPSILGLDTFMAGDENPALMVRGGGDNPYVDVWREAGSPMQSIATGNAATAAKFIGGHLVIAMTDRIDIIAEEPTSIATRGTPLSMAVINFDGDSVLDVLVRSSDGK